MAGASDDAPGTSRPPSACQEAESDDEALSPSAYLISGGWLLSAPSLFLMSAFLGFWCVESLVSCIFREGGRGTEHEGGVASAASSGSAGSERYGRLLFVPREAGERVVSPLEGTGGERLCSR